MLHQPQGIRAKRLAVVGGGKRAAFDSPRLRKAVGSAVRALKQKGVKRWPGGCNGADPEAAVEGAMLGNFEPDQHKTAKRGKVAGSVSHVVAAANGAELEQRLRARTHSRPNAQNFTRDLANEPANLLTPLVLADRARAMAAESGLECEVLDQDRMRQLGMGSLLGVAQGSAEPPALIIVRYKPAVAVRNPPIIWDWSARASPSTPAASPSSPPTAWRR